jgi:hypothetical protein
MAEVRYRSLAGGKNYKYLATPWADSLVDGDGQYIPPTGNNHNHLQPPKTQKYLAKHPLARSNITE